MAERLPDVTFFELDNIPSELREQQRWITWRWREDSEGKLQKVPTDPHAGHNINDKDPANWMRFSEARGHAEAGACEVAGVGFCFSDADPYCGVDYDDCRDPATGKIKEEVLKDIERLNSYTEISPSGTGVKVYCRGVLPRSGKRGSVEMYDRRRYFTVTGWHLGGTPKTIRSAQKELVEINRRVFGEAREGVHGGIPDPMSPELDDSEVLEKRRSDKDANKAEKFARLFDGGDLSGYGGDHSHADLGLVNLLAYYTQDPVQLDRLFRRSALMREKWDERHRGDGANYGEMTIEKALVGRKPEDCWRGTEKAPGPSEAVDEGGIGERSLVGRAIIEGIEPPELLVDGLIYRGGIHSWIAEGETGKSMLALWVSILVMRQGENVLYLDQEGAVGMVAERLEAMGADPETLDRRFHYYQSSSVTLAQEPLTDLLKKAREANAALVVFDSWADFLALDGLDENDSMDVTRWVTKVVYPLRDLPAACLLLDHSNKEAKGKGGRGSTAKRNKMDASHKLQKVGDFHRDKVGKVRFAVDKDRLGAMDRTAAFLLGGDGTGRIVCRREGSVRFVVDDLSSNQKKAFVALGKGGLRTGEWKEKTGLGNSSFYKVRKALVEEQGLVKQGADGLHYPTSESLHVEAGGDD